MKNYEKPELIIEKIELTDVITTSLALSFGLFEDADEDSKVGFSDSLWG